MPFERLLKGTTIVPFAFCGELPDIFPARDLNISGELFNTAVENFVEKVELTFVTSC